MRTRRVRDRDVLEPGGAAGRSVNAGESADGTAPGLDGDRVLDLGALRLPDVEGVTLRFVAEPGTEAATAVVVEAEAVAMELAVFAAPKSQPLGAPVLRQLLASAGPGAVVGSGPYGSELLLTDGRKIIGVDGPRWFLRVVVAAESGQGTRAPAACVGTGSAVLDQVLRELVVVRGGGAVPPRTALPLRPPGVGAPDAVPVSFAGFARPTGTATLTEVRFPVHELAPPFTAGLSRNLSTWG